MSLNELMEKAEQQAIEDYHSLIDDYGWTVEAAKKEILSSTCLNRVKKYIEGLEQGIKP